MSIIFNFFKKETRSDTEMIADFVSGVTPQNRIVTKNEALSIPAVSKSVDWIAAVMAGLPIKLYKKTEKGYIEVYDDYRLPLLNEFSSTTMTANDLKHQIILDLLLEGNGYAYISKRGNKITKLSYVPTSRITYTESIDTINKVINVWIDGKQVQDYNVFRLVTNSKNGFSGVGFVSDCQNLLSTILSSLEYENSTISSGMQRGFLKSKAKLDTEKMNQLRQAWRRLISPKQTDVMVLNAGIEFESASNNATESQLSQNKSINIQQVLTWFGLPTNFLEGASSESYLSAVRIAILPLVRRFVTALNNYMLLESEKSYMKFDIDTSDILRINANERYAAYQAGLQSGILTIDEVRRMENLPVLDMQYLKLGLGDVLYNINDGKIFVPNTGTIVDPSVATNDDENTSNDDEQASN